MTGYIIVEAPDRTALEDAVSRQLPYGWVPAGGPYVTPRGYLGQALTRNETTVAKTKQMKLREPK